jgi:tetratricopeptide (TPR) repeat protein
MPAIFISHSSLDNQASDEIKASLARAGFEQVFLDFDKDSGIGAGDNWERRLYEELSRCHAVILVLTPNWLSSTWCRIELAQARALGKVILPLICAPLGERYVLPEVQAVDLMDWNAGGLERLTQRLNAITSELARGFRLHPDRPPYPGIHAFEAEDAAIYFGRDDETRAVIERLDARRSQGGARLLVIIGASGSGKSSLLRAGILPQIGRRRRDWITLPPIRPEKAPLETVAKAIAEHLGKPETWRSWHERLGKPEAANDVEELLKDLRIGESRSATVLLPIDQFEELFTVAAPPERAAFLRLVAATLDPARDLPLMVLATGRSDVLEGLIQAGDLAHLTETYPLPLMPLDRVPRLVEGPATVVGLNVEAGLSERIARDVETAEALPLLAHTLWLLYRRSAESKRLTLAEYEALGDSQRGLNPIQNSVRLVADQAISGLRPTPDELSALRDAFVPHLVRVRLEDGKRVRQAAPLSELPADSLRLIRALAQARLLTIRGADDGRDGNAEHATLIEVTHEALFKAWPDLDDWLTQEHAFLTDLERIRGAHEVWSQAPADEKPSALLHGLLLTRSRDWMMRYPQRFVGREIAPVRAFVIDSAAADDAERARIAEGVARTRRMERTLFRGAIAASIVMTLLAGFAGVAAWQAVESQERASRNFELTVGQADTLVTKLSTELKDRVGISQDVIRRILDLIEARFGEMTKVQADSPRLALSRANMLSAFAENYIDLGEMEKARGRAQECAEITRPLLAASNEDLATERMMARCLEKLADSLRMRAAYKDASDSFAESIGLRRRILAKDPASDEAQLALAHGLTYSSANLREQGNIEEAFKQANESVSISLNVVAKDVSNAASVRELVDSLNTYSIVVDAKGQLEEAAKGFRQARDLTRRLADDDPGNATLLRFLSNIMANLADPLMKLRRYDEALATLKDAVDVKYTLTSADPQNTTWDFEICRSLLALANTQLQLGKNPEVLAAANEGNDRLRKLVGRDPKNRAWRLELVFGLAILMEADKRIGDAAGARAAAQEGLAVTEVLGTDALKADENKVFRQIADSFSHYLAEPQPQPPPPQQPR